jgi:pyruvate dehydrogenase phosphatase regulatory subunit
MIGPTAQQTRSYAWIKDHLPEDGSVVLSDVTSMYTAINVIGPKAQELLSELTDAPLGKQDFHHMTCKVMMSCLVEM